jgi:exodeoxyribonuclease-3
MKIFTWNVNSIRARLEILTTYIKATSPDIIAMQETKVVDEDFPAGVFKDLGYDIEYSGQKSYNGVAVISRVPYKNVKKDIFDTNNEKRTIQIEFEDFTLINCYFPHGGLRTDEKFFKKLEFYKRMKNYIEKNGLIRSQTILLGDFNVAPEEIDVWDSAFLQDSIGFMKEEREAFKELIDAGLIDLFRLFHKEDKAFTWWDYRAQSFRKNEGMRIDHILITENLKNHAANCFIDKEPRKLKGTTDHAPLWGEFTF